MEYNKYGELVPVIDENICIHCNLCKKICPNNDERMNIILDMTYGYKGNRQFCWDCIGELIIKRLEEMEEEVVYTE